MQSLRLYQIGMLCVRSTTKINQTTSSKLQQSILRWASSSTAERLYTSKHEWIVVQHDANVKNEGTVGITDYAQKALGDIVYAQLPDPGTEVKKEEDCGALESVKAASEIYSPVSGTVTDKNVAAEEKPQLINKDCYGQGWLYKVVLSDPSELDSLMKEKAYEAFCKSLQDEAH